MRFGSAKPQSLSLSEALRNYQQTTLAKEPVLSPGQIEYNAERRQKDYESLRNYTAQLEIDEYLRRSLQLRHGKEPIRAAGESEARMPLPYQASWRPENKSSIILQDAADAYLEINRRKRVEVEEKALGISNEESNRLLLSHQTQFTVEHNWHNALCKAIKEVKDDEIELPFSTTIFEFTYLDTPMRGEVQQDQETYELKLLSVYVSPAGADAFVVRPWYLANKAEEKVFLEHVRYTCVALETELAGKEQQVMPEFLKALKPAARTALKAPTATYKVLPIRRDTSGVKSATGPTGIMQRFHVRRSHWKKVKGIRRRIKWYFAGNIELGIIIKDYILD